MQKLREGTLHRHKSTFLSSKWKECFAILYSDSTLCLYNNRNDVKPTESIFLKNVVPYICVGQMTDRMPVKRPELPLGVSIQRLVGIGMDTKAEKVHWILFPSENDLEIWFNEIVTTLPKPVNPSLNPINQPNQYPQEPSNTFVPPAKYPSAPPPVKTYNPNPQNQHQNYQQPNYPPPNYPQQNVYDGKFAPQYPSSYVLPPQQQTIIIDRGSGGSSGGFGGQSGLALGGGMLMGGLLGYGLGSGFGGLGHGYGGFGGGYGGSYGNYGGGGFGGGYQDNDTYITNNYYNNQDDNSSNNPIQTNSPVIDNDITDYNSSTVDDYVGNDYDNGDGGSWGGDNFDGGGGDW